MSRAFWIAETSGGVRGMFRLRTDVSRGDSSVSAGRIALQGLTGLRIEDGKTLRVRLVLEKDWMALRAENKRLQKELLGVGETLDSVRRRHHDETRFTAERPK